DALAHRSARPFGPRPRGVAAEQEREEERGRESAREEQVARREPPGPARPAPAPRSRKGEARLEPLPDPGAVIGPAIRRLLGANRLQGDPHPPELGPAGGAVGEVRLQRPLVVGLPVVVEHQVVRARMPPGSARHCATPMAGASTWRTLRTARSTLCLAALASRSRAWPISAIDIPSKWRRTNADISCALLRLIANDNC